MKIGYISCFSKWHTEVDIAEALERAGHEVSRYHYSRVDKRKFLERANKFDFLITAVPHTLPVEFFLKAKERGPKLIAWYFDWIWDYIGRDKQYIKRLKHFDLVLSSDGAMGHRYEELGIKRHYMKMACNPSYVKPVKLTPSERREYRSDVGFVGHNYFGRRNKLLNGLSRDFNFNQWGQQSEAYGITHSKICSATKIMVADNFRNDIDGYWSNRIYLEVGAGAFLLHPRIGWADKFFKDGEHLVYWDSEKDLHQKIRYYLKNEAERKEIAKNGSKHIREKHNWDIRVKEFEDILCESGLSHTQISQAA